MIIRKSSIQKKRTSFWFWIPTLYLAQGLPYAVVITLSVIMYKRLGISNAEILFYTSWFFIPWIIKPLWAPIVDVLKTKRFWITGMQLSIGICLAGVAFSINAPDFFYLTLMFFWIIAFLSATHDVAADGFFMLELSEYKQTQLIGIKNAFYKIAIVFGPTLFLLLASFLEGSLSLTPTEINVSIKSEGTVEKNITIDTTSIKPIEGKLKIIANPPNLVMINKNITREMANFYLNFANEFNTMNGLDIDKVIEPDTSYSQDEVGNIAIMKLYLSKQPDEGEELIVKITEMDGSEGIKIIEGNELKFTSRNWNKPAYVVFQIDQVTNQPFESKFIAQSDKNSLAWMLTIGSIAILYFIFFIYHQYVLPKPVTDKSILRAHRTNPLNEFFRTFFRFFEKEKIIVVIGFLIFSLIGQSQLVKIIPTFMLDSKELGGLNLNTAKVELINGIVGTIALIIGGIIGGLAISRNGLKKLLWWILFAINIPNTIYIFFAFLQPTSIISIIVCHAFVQLAFGFGFVGIVMYAIYLSDGEYKTSHYSIAISFVMVGMLIFGMLSQTIQTLIGYKYFFIWVVAASLPSFILAKFIPLNASFGKFRNNLTN